MSQLAKQLLLPPASLIIILLIGLVLARRRWDLGWWTAIAAGSLLYVLATPLASGTLSRILETYPPLPTETLPASQAQAIVILGSDSIYAAEYDGDTVGSLTLVRLRYGAQLHARTGLPILVSGGQLNGTTISLAEQMRRVLSDEYQIPDVWMEARSRNTWENATDSALILRSKHIERIYLVAHARDMARALGAFRQTGLIVTPAPIAFEEHKAEGLRNVVPSVRSLMASYYALYELAGGLEYMLRPLLTL